MTPHDDIHPPQVYENFEGKEIRIVESDGQKWMPLPDLAAAWGVDRNTPEGIVSRNKESFAGMYRDCYVTSTSKKEEVCYTCVNERGLYLLMGKISVSRLKNKNAKASIVRFQRWVANLVQQVRKGEVITTLPSKYDETLQKLQFSKKVGEITGWDQNEIYKRVLEEGGFYAISRAAPVPVKVPVPSLPAPSEPFKVKPYMTPTEIGLLNGSTPRQINQWLYNNAYQIKDSVTDEWRLTPLGFKFAKEQVVKFDTGHEGVVIWWTPKILEKMNINVKES